MKKPNYDRIPKTVELFGRVIKTIDDTKQLTINGNYGEARYGVNEIALSKSMPNGRAMCNDENKVTYLHELIHFILNFTTLDQAIHRGEKIDIEVLIELLASGIYQYEKTAKY